MITTSKKPIIFNNHDEWIKKFTERPKTTDDTFTPPDIYEAVLKYVATVTDLSGRQILRPFFPGGDYEHAEYPPNGIVIDNPPFSIFSRIVRFYAQRRIPFFLFGPGITITSICDVATAVIIGGGSITFSNGAAVRCNFASNLYGDTIICTAPLLTQLIRACPSQRQQPKRPCRKYPDELLSVSDMQTIASGDVPFAVARDDAVRVHALDATVLFGHHFLVSTETAKAKAEAKAKAKNVEIIRLSGREKQLIAALNHQQNRKKNEY